MVHWLQIDAIGRRERKVECLAQRLDGTEQPNRLHFLLGYGGDPGQPLDAVDDGSEVPLGRSEVEAFVEQRHGPGEIAQVRLGQPQTGQYVWQDPARAVLAG